MMFNENNDNDQYFHSFKIESPLLSKNYLSANDMKRSNSNGNSVKRVRFSNETDSTLFRLSSDTNYQQEQNFDIKQHLNTKTISNSLRTNLKRPNHIDNDSIQTYSRNQSHRNKTKFIKPCTKFNTNLDQINLIDENLNENIKYDSKHQKLKHKIRMHQLRPLTPLSTTSIRENRMIESPSPIAHILTPLPIELQEGPSTSTKYQSTKLVTRKLSPPPIPLRRVAARRNPPLPSRPRPIIIEKWLRYRPSPERATLYQRTELFKTIETDQDQNTVQHDESDVENSNERFQLITDRHGNQYSSIVRHTQSIRKILRNIRFNSEFSAPKNSKTCSHTSHYDHPRKTINYFIDEKSDELTRSSYPIVNNHYYDMPRK